MSAAAVSQVSPATAVDPMIDSVGELLSIDSYLNRVDYRVPAGYVPSDFALEFVTFIKLVNGEEGEENATPLVHYWMLDTLAGLGSGGNARRIANLCHRGLAKTTLFGEYLILYIAVYGRLPGFGEIDLALYVSDSIDNGVKNMRKNLEHRLDRSEFLHTYIPKIAFTDIRWEFQNIDGRKFVVRGYGAKTGVRGTKEMGKRPQLAILDDLISDEDARSQTVIASVEATIYKAIDYALHPKQNLIIWSGTPFNASDPLYKAVESGAWRTNVFPVCERFPCTREEFRGSWPDRFDYDYVLHQYQHAQKLGKIDTFMQELMLRIMSDEDRLIHDTDIQWYQSPGLLAHRSRYNFYVTTDFATSERQSADLSIVSVWAYNNRGQWFWVDGTAARQSMDKNIDDLFRLCQAFGPQQVGIEVSGQQQAFIPWIQREMLERNVFFSFATEGNAGKPGLRPTTSKMERFNLVVPLIKSQRIFFPADKRDHPAMIEAMDELRLVSPGGMKSRHDDFLDNMSQLPMLNPWKPSEEDPTRIRESGIFDDGWGGEEDSAMDSYIV